MYDVKIVLDSIANGKRLVTFQLTYPRYIHAELMTHRVFSRNASSSRAIPAAKLIENSLKNAVYPIRWGKNQAGMQASMEDLSDNDSIAAKEIWDEMMIACANGVRALSELGLHKQWANRPLEWFGTISVVVTATEWDNWFELRDHPDAQPEIQHLAKMMRVAMDESVPEALYAGDWHLPYITKEEKMTIASADTLKMSVARCARVSYLTHDGQTPDKEKDLALYDRLVGSVPLHASPTEHQATPFNATLHSEQLQGNFRGWSQYRKFIEKDFGK